MAAYPFQPLVEVIVRAFADLLSVPFLSFLWSWVKRIIPLFVAFLILLSIGLSAYTFFRQKQDRQLKFFVTAGNGGGSDQVDLIQKKIRNQWSFWGPNYLVTEFQTGGSLDNLRNVKRDQEGNSIGVAIEGLNIDKNDTDDLHTLVPLQWCYLHFIYRTKSLENLGIHYADPKDNHGSAVTPISFSEWATRYVDLANKAAHDNPTEKAEVEKAWPIRVYLGQPNSGTRQLAEMILKNAGISPSSVEPTGYIADVQVIPEKLLRDKIDGAFILEPPGSPIVNQLATNKEVPCTLLSIDGVSDLMPSNPFLVEGTISPYTYAWPSWEDGKAGNKKMIDRDLHLSGVNTLAARRILVASSKMGNSDAYYLANLVRDALSAKDIARRTEDGYWPAPNDKKDANRSLNYDLHPGVVWNTTVEPGINWVGRNATWVGPLLLAMGISLVTEVKNRISRSLADEPPATTTIEIKTPQEPTPSNSSAHAEIDAQIERILKEIHDSGDNEIDTKRPTSPEVIGGWRKEIGALYRKVHADYRSKVLTADEKIAFNARLLQLRNELKVLRSHPWGVALARSRRGKKKRAK